MDADADVALYGATGYTGRLIAHALDAAGASVILAGRSADKLRALASQLRNVVDVAAVEVSDAAELEALAARARVLASAAGPFVDLGPPVLRAALAARRHYVDITGEQAYLRHVFAQDAEAREAGVTLVPATGFDVVPSDVAAALAARAITQAGGEVEALDLVIDAGRGISRGTRRSMARAAGTGWWYDDGRYRAGPPGRFTGAFEMPDPEHPPRTRRRDAMFISWGDVVTAPRTTGAKRVRTYFTTSAAQARILRVAWPLAGALLSTGFVRRRLARAAEEAQEGPSEERRKVSRFAILAQARGSDGRTARAVVHGFDPYGLTGRTCAEYALRLSRGGVAPGAWSPVQALGLEGALEALASTGASHAMLPSVDGR